jgi:hypothetical protein
MQQSKIVYECGSEELIVLLGFKAAYSNNKQHEQSLSWGLEDYKAQQCVIGL